jgi:hypothetical protein
LMLTTPLIPVSDSLVYYFHTFFISHQIPSAHDLHPILRHAIKNIGHSIIYRDGLISLETKEKSAGTISV